MSPEAESSVAETPLCEVQVQGQTSRYEVSQVSTRWQAQENGATELCSIIERSRYVNTIWPYVSWQDESRDLRDRRAEKLKGSVVSVDAEFRQLCGHRLHPARGAAEEIHGVFGPRAEREQVLDLLEIH